MFIIKESTEAGLPSTMSFMRRSNDDDCYGWSCGSEWVWARWILFVFFILAIAALALTAIRVNGKRVRMGQRPIAGTAWFMPPTYRQSERDVRGSTQDYVPPYTETANPNDLGYYDNQGIFHLNSKAENAEAAPPFTEPQTNEGSPQFPSPAVTQNISHERTHSLDFSRDYHQYYRGTATEQNIPDLRGETSREVQHGHLNTGTNDESANFEMEQRPPTVPQNAHVNGA
ncbi:LADA_0F05996g1_1 [Lachancea dasiensis]|uniref:LADA_0F05996g1_1 n=1 Tax=Lachancea dasiensis TaxID=1072105 RepID=A0A1G4JJU6_9SACH|nr:LADA_0F05996g1_1 [Lachancea dasiensis]